MIRSAGTTGTGAKAGTIALWVLQIALGLAFVINFGPGKLLGSDQAVQTFAEIGAGQWLRYLTGTLEVAGGIGLLIPRLSGLAALGLVGVMSGAILTELVLLDGDVLVPLILLVLLATIAWFRRDRTLALVEHLRPRTSHRQV
ncbi:DoxX family protein [Actinoplanes sp. CA-051413]|uniref:DoxX family protein n=1 Tax=Actinoplanes sp. CA-051413 TaxID=3239899 RepID=UPI003D963DED